MSSIVTEDEAISLIEREIPLREIGNQSPSLYLTILQGLQKIRYIDPEKAEGRRDYVLKDDLSKVRLSMPAEIQWAVYTLQGYKSFHNFSRGMFNTVGSVVGFTASLGLAAQNHTDNVSIYIAAGLLGLSAAVFQVKGIVHLVNSFRKAYQQKSDERFAKPLNQRESKLVEYIFMNDRSL
ncbi:MAG: hypothetical protein Q8L34_07005 [Candidatus Woesearchaeota archaeon]|nr:hypothetical protein [Candidatus Woesearchaeota archaeon]